MKMSNIQQPNSIPSAEGLRKTTYYGHVPLKHASLFSGIGGFDLAAEWMGWENVFHCEINKYCQQILKQNFPKSILYEDIKKTDFKEWNGKIDIISGGFPCQPYSNAGKRKGKEDDRHLWPEMLRAIREVQPAWIVGENVAGLLNWNGGMVLSEIKTDLENSGFEVFPPCILPACGKNAPHRRDRLWIVAYSRHNSERKATHSSTNEGSEFATIHTERQVRKSKAVFNNRLCDLHRDAADTNNQGLQRSKKHGGIKEVGKDGNKQFAGV